MEQENQEQENLTKNDYLLVFGIIIFAIVLIIWLFKYCLVLFGGYLIYRNFSKLRSIKKEERNEREEKDSELIF